MAGVMRVALKAAVSDDKRTVVVVVLLFLAAIIIYLVFFAPDDELRRSEVAPAFGLAGTVLLGWLGFKSWDYKNQLAAAPTPDTKTE